MGGSHSRAELRSWATRLRYFRYCLAIGGHANDGDQLLVALRYQGADDLRSLLQALGVTPVNVPPPSVPGPDPIPDCPGLGQPEHQVLAGHPCFLWPRGGRLQLSLSDLANPYEVTASVVEAARRIEPLLAELTARVIDPPLDDYHCLCPKYHPDLWA